MSRVSRGFHRIVIVVAAVPSVLGCWLGGRETWLLWSARDPLASIPSNVFDQFDPPAYVANYRLPLLLLGTAFALYAVARAFGWVVDGFTRS